jgi:hypothetical protein
MHRADAVAAVIEQATRQNGGRARKADLPGDGVGGASGLHGLEQIAAEDRRMLAAMLPNPVDDLADVPPAGSKAASHGLRRSASQDDRAASPERGRARPVDPDRAQVQMKTMRPVRRDDIPLDLQHLPLGPRGRNRASKGCQSGLKGFPAFSNPRY